MKKTSSVIEIIQVYEFQTKENPDEDIFLISVWILSTHLDDSYQESKIKHLQKRSLRIVYNDHITSFEDLLKKDNSFKIHHKNIQLLAIELFKSRKELLIQF